MSSVTSSYAQKSGRSKFLLGVRAPRTSDGENTWPSAFTFQDGYGLPHVPTSVLARSVFNNQDNYQINVFTNDGNFVGTLFRDLGRQLVIYDDSTSVAGSPRRDVYRECAVVDGTTSEGLDAQVNVWVKVFSVNAAYPSVAVARTG